MPLLEGDSHRAASLFVPSGLGRGFVVGALDQNAVMPPWPSRSGTGDT